MGNILWFADFAPIIAFAAKRFLCRLPIVSAAALLRHVGSDKSGATASRNL